MLYGAIDVSDKALMEIFIQDAEKDDQDYFAVSFYFDNLSLIIASFLPSCFGCETKGEWLVANSATSLMC